MEKTSMEKVKEYLKQKKDAIVKIVDSAIDLVPIGHKATEFAKKHKVTFVLVVGVLIDVIVGGLDQSKIVELVDYVFQLTGGA